MRLNRHDRKISWLQRNRLLSLLLVSKNDTIALSKNANVDNFIWRLHWTTLRRNHNFCFTPPHRHRLRTDESVWVFMTTSLPIIISLHLKSCLVRHSYYILVRLVSPSLGGWGKDYFTIEHSTIAFVVPFSTNATEPSLFPHNTTPIFARFIARRMVLTVAHWRAPDRLSGLFVCQTKHWIKGCSCPPSLWPTRSTHWSFLTGSNNNLPHPPHWHQPPLDHHQWSWSIWTPLFTDPWWGLPLPRYNLPSVNALCMIRNANAPLS